MSINTRNIVEKLIVIAVCVMIFVYVGYAQMAPLIGNPTETFNYAPNNWCGVHWFTNSHNVLPAYSSWNSNPYINEWQNVSVATWVPVGATGVVLDIHGMDHVEQCEIRAVGSTDDFYTYSYVDWMHLMVLVKLDSNREFQIKGQDGLGSFVHVWLMGYTDNTVTYFVNGIDKSTASLSSWVDVDVSANVASDANGVIVKMVNTDAVLHHQHNATVRCKGSTDARTTYIQIAGMDDCVQGVSTYAVVGINSAKIFQQYIDNNHMDLYVMGYTENTTFYWYANTVLIAGFTNNTWIDVASGTGANSTGIFAELLVPCICELRKPGSTDNRTSDGVHNEGGVMDPYGHTWHGCGLNSTQCFQMFGNLYSNPHDPWVYLYGYTKINFQNDTVTLATTPTSLTSVKVNGATWTNYNRTALNVQLNNLYEDSTIQISYLTSGPGAAFLPFFVVFCVLFCLGLALMPLDIIKDAIKGLGRKA